MEKYLGNKSSIVPLIHDFLSDNIPHARSISDVFAGTNNVARYFHGRGWDVSTCDVNRFSFVLAHAYLIQDREVKFDGLIKQLPRRKDERLTAEWFRQWSRYGDLYHPGTDAHEALGKLEALQIVLTHLQETGHKNRTPGFITAYYSSEGLRATFKSRSGVVGKRNYFSHENALFLDSVLTQLREWWLAGSVTKSEAFLVLASIIEEVVITANVNGTFHDFNRTVLWPNSKQPFFLRLPQAVQRPQQAEAWNGDVLEVANQLDYRDVAYLDPPYNFRQYNAYYHLLNFVAAYPFLGDVEEYLEDVAHVRGQSVRDDYASAFCYRSRFTDSLRRVISDVNSGYVLMSYYGGRNHWNHWSRVEEPTDEGLRELRAVFEDNMLFDDAVVVPVLDVRTNYQSRKGERKSLVNEYLLMGRKLQSKGTPVIRRPSFTLNSRLGIENVFANASTLGQQLLQ